VFPETFVPWYPYFSFVRPPVLSGADHIHLYDNAVVVPGPVTDAVAQAARRHNVVVVLGVNERDSRFAVQRADHFRLRRQAAAETTQAHPDIP